MKKRFANPADELHRHARSTRLIYESLLGEETWDRLLACLTREFNSTYSVVLTRKHFTRSVQISATDVLPEERQRAYETYYSRLCPVSFFNRDDFNVGEVFTDGLYSDYEFYLKSQLYCDFFRPLRADHLMFMPLPQSASGERSLVLRRSHAAGFYDDGAVRRLRLLGTHIANAESLAAKMRVAHDKAENLEKMIGRLGIVAFVTDRTGKVHHMTEAAEDLLSAGTVFRMAGGRVACRDATLEREFKAAIRVCADSIDRPGKEASGMARVSWPEHRARPLTASISAITWSDAGRSSDSASLIVVNGPESRLARQATRAANLFGLTPAESLLVESLCAGRSLSQHAALAHISLGTARTHLKRALSKTETHSQTELVGLLLRNSALIVL